MKDLVRCLPGAAWCSEPWLLVTAPAGPGVRAGTEGALPVGDSLSGTRESQAPGLTLASLTWDACIPKVTSANTHYEQQIPLLGTYGILDPRDHSLWMSSLMSHTASQRELRMFSGDILGEGKCPLQGDTASNWQGLGLNRKLASDTRALSSLPPTVPPKGQDGGAEMNMTQTLTLRSLSPQAREPLVLAVMAGLTQSSPGPARKDRTSQTTKENSKTENALSRRGV